MHSPLNVKFYVQGKKTANFFDTSVKSYLISRSHIPYGSKIQNHERNVLKCSRWFEKWRAQDVGSVQNITR